MLKESEENIENKWCFVGSEKFLSSYIEKIENNEITTLEEIRDQLIKDMKETSEQMSDIVSSED